MELKQLTPQETQSILTENPMAVYVDVRTVAEFADGHPRGKVVNIPILFYHPTTKAVFPNESFLLVMEHYYPKETTLIIGCDTGERAQQAAERLLTSGYQDVAVLEGGYTQWREQQLPKSLDNRDGISYVSLLTKIKRKGKKKAAHA